MPGAAHLLAEWEKATGDRPAKDRVVHDLIAVVAALEKAVDKKADADMLISSLINVQVDVSKHKEALMALAEVLQED